MPLIPWNEALSIGIESIDEQHKKIVEMLNLLSDALAEGEADSALEKIFSGLAVYTVEHFSYEEGLFAKYGYEGEQAHIDEHKALNKQVQELQEKMRQGDFMISVEVMSFLKDWLTNHILVTDKAYASFLIDKGVK